jgi:hypothetical protein
MQTELLAVSFWTYISNSITGPAEYNTALPVVCAPGSTGRDMVKSKQTRV